MMIIVDLRCPWPTTTISMTQPEPQFKKFIVKLYHLINLKSVLLKQVISAQISQ